MDSSEGDRTNRRAEGRGNADSSASNDKVAFLHVSGPLGTFVFNREKKGTAVRRLLFAAKHAAKYAPARKLRKIRSVAYLAVAQQTFERFSNHWNLSC